MPAEPNFKRLDEVKLVKLDEVKLVNEQVKSMI